MRLFSLFHKKSSRQVAKDRLKILLISDRVNCSSEMMELIKNDIASMDIQITKTGVTGRNTKMPVLYANIPILDLKN